MGIIKQSEKLWLVYRTKGWGVDRFTMAIKGVGGMERNRFMYVLVDDYN
jgi:hypothetical protein